MPEEVKLLLGLLEELNQQNADAISMDELDLQEEDWEWEFLYYEVSGGDAQLSRKDLEEALAWWGYDPPEIELLIDLADRFYYEPNLELIIIDELDLDDWERDFLLGVSGGDVELTLWEIEYALDDWFAPPEVKLLLGLLEELGRQDTDLILIDELDLEEGTWELFFLHDISGADRMLSREELEEALSWWGYASPEIMLLLDLESLFHADPDLLEIDIEILDIDESDWGFLYYDVSGGDGELTLAEVEEALSWFDDRLPEDEADSAPLFSDTFSVIISVSNAADQVELQTFGFESESTDQIDPPHEEELPPLPPAEVFDVRFQILGTNGIDTDLRAPDENAQTIWTLQMQSGNGGFPLLVEWNPDLLPPIGSFYLRDAITGGDLVHVDMRSQNSLLLENPALNQIQIAFNPLAEYTFELSAGWNMISLPLAVADASLEATFPHAISLFGFNDGYHAADRLEPLNGYWINLAEQAEVTIIGAPYDECRTEIPGGWTMVGPCGSQVDVAGLQEENPALVSVFGFGSSYFAAEAMEPGWGYWTNMATSGELDLGSVRVLKPVAARPHNGAFAGAVLWAASLDRRQTIDLGGQWQLLLNEQVIDLRGAGSLAVEPAAVLQVRRLGALALPQTYSLAQNFPNPFNPSTTIRYNLKEAGAVSLRIYDVMGQRVRELVDAPQPAGRYQVIWDGRDQRGTSVANGVYFYELRAGEFRALRKMVLMK